MHFYAPVSNYLRYHLEPPDLNLTFICRNNFFRVFPINQCTKCLVMIFLQYLKVQRESFNYLLDIFKRGDRISLAAIFIKSPSRQFYSHPLYSFHFPVSRRMSLTSTNAGEQL